MAKRKKKGFDAGTAASTAQGIKGGLELYNNWNTAAQAGTPVLRGLAADYGSGIAGQGAAAFPGTVGAADATAGALGTAGGTAADVAGTAGGMVGTTLGEAIPALGQAYAIWSLGKQWMQSGNYQNLLKVFDGEFGEYVKLLGWKKEDEEDLEGSISESSSEKEKRK